jgi:hypothetical protein
LRQAKKRLAFCLGVIASVSALIHQALASDASHSAIESLEQENAWLKEQLARIVRDK